MHRDAFCLKWLIRDFDNSHKDTRDQQANSACQTILFLRSPLHSSKHSLDQALLEKEGFRHRHIQTFCLERLC